MKPRVLYVLHCFNNRAGTEEHVRALVRGLQNDYECFVVYPEENLIHIRQPRGQETLLPSGPARWPVTPYNDAVTELALTHVLEQVAPDLIHVQHFLNWPLCIIDKLADTGKPTLVSLHDYYAITPHFTMEQVQDPAECFTAPYAERIFNGDISEYLNDRRRVIGGSLARASKLIAPSQATASIIQAIFPLPIQVIHHGIPHIAAPAVPRGKRTGIIRFGYVGSLLPQKGWEVLLAAFRLMRAEFPDSELHFYGGASNLQEERVFFHGVYNQEELPEILAAIDVGVIPSLFRESFSLTLSELQMSGAPCIVSDIGALSERIDSGKTGLKVPPGEAQALADALRAFCADQGWRTWQIPAPRHFEAMIGDYRSLYSELMHHSAQN